MIADPCKMLRPEIPAELQSCEWIQLIQNGVKTRLSREADI